MEQGVADEIAAVEASSKATITNNDDYDGVRQKSFIIVIV